MSMRSTDQTRHRPAPLVIPLEQLRAVDVAVVGGKAANLGELVAAGFPVPAGFCVSTTAFQHFIAAQPDRESLNTLLDTLTEDDVEPVRQAGQQMRDTLRRAPIPDDVAEAVVTAWRALGVEDAYAVRSSATVEDSPTASFAGQQDTLLNVRGETALLNSIRECWASLFTDRAILYRLHEGIDHRTVQLAVVVQLMVEPQVSGIMFTADPVTGNRTMIAIDASFGLGEALVSGVVSPDRYQVNKRTRTLVTRQIADKRLMVRSLPGGGVESVEVPLDLRTQPALTDAQVYELAALGARIEAHYRIPQDIEWGLDDGRFVILQARPITTLFPLPQPVPRNDGLHVYFSFSHFQVMTDPLPDLVSSLWRVIVPAGRPAGELENTSMAVAGGRLYIDLSALLHHRMLGRVVPLALTSADALAARAIAAVAAREAFRRQGHTVSSVNLLTWIVPLLSRVLLRLVRPLPESTTAFGLRLMDRHLARAETRLAAAPDRIARLTVAVDLLSDIVPTIFRTWFPYFIAGELAHGLLVRLLQGVAQPGDLEAVVRGVEGNVVTEMNLAVGDLADLIRQSPELAQHLSRQRIGAQMLLDTATSMPGGSVFMAAWQSFIARYGMRATGEIDLRRPRWHEDPGSLLQMILSNAGHSEAGMHRAQHRRLVLQGEAAAERLIRSASGGPLGRVRGLLTRRLVRLTRQLLPTREHHKFWVMRLLGMVKPVLLEAGEHLVARGRISEVDDVWFVTVPELLAVLDRPGKPLQDRVAERRAAFERFKVLMPPHVMTSEGEIPFVAPAAADVPSNALLGTAASPGIVDGIARVVRDPYTTLLKHGEILVAPFTDPGWTPLFITAAAIVTEVGGVMTHGSVVAREYGIPAVVGVTGATTSIRTGQRIRVNGTAGYVEILDPEIDVTSPSGHATAHHEQSRIPA